MLVVEKPVWPLLVKTTSPEMDCDRGKSTPPSTPTYPALSLVAAAGVAITSATALARRYFRIGYDPWLLVYEGPNMRGQRLFREKRQQPQRCGKLLPTGHT